MAITLDGTDGVTTTGLTSNGIDDNATSTAVTIDSSGNLLVGKTAVNSNAAGFEAESDGKIAATRDGSRTAIFNRLTSDGEIVAFRKDGSTVGSIGVTGVEFYIDGAYNVNRSGLELSYQAISPRLGQANANGTVDLGASGRRFRNLYLSDGAYLGGTAAANQLDDYEEGTFTPTLSGGATAGTTTYSIQAGYYTKIGRMVHVTCMISYTSATGTGSYNIGGLPFTSANLNQNYSVGSILTSNLNYSSGTNLIPLQMQNTNYIIPFYVSDDGQANTQSIINEVANFRLSLTYYTS